MNNSFKIYQNSKIFNFVPTYDKWCLYCDNRNCEKKCSKCKSVYFCNEHCQKKTWKIHKKHCGRNLFSNCITCGKNIVSKDYEKCFNCPVKFCCSKCKDRILKDHCDIDCKYFAETFGKTYLEY